MISSIRYSTHRHAVYLNGDEPDCKSINKAQQGEEAKRERERKAQIISNG